MQRQDAVQGPFFATFTLMELIFHAIVRELRKAHGNALVSLLLNILQTFIFVAIFYAVFTLVGLRGTALRGDFLLYVMSGIFLFLTFSKSMGAVAGADGPAAPMMKHAPMNTIIAVAGAAVSTLYIQVVSMVLVLWGYHVLITPITIYQPIPAMGMVLLAWFWGCCIGMVFYALKPWLPRTVAIVMQVFSRANMIASGKMFVANAMPSSVLAMFDWNPLFHIIDQSRGYAFKNYNPHFSDWTYAFWVSVAFLMLGLMGEFYTRRRVSLSWSAGK